MKYVILLLSFFCLAANAQPAAKVGEVANSPTLKTEKKPKNQDKYNALALAQTVLQHYIQNADTIRTSDRKRKINTYIFFYTKENIDIPNKKIKNCLIWNRNKENFTKKDAFPLEINKSDTIIYRFIEIIVEKDTIDIKKQRIALYFNTLTFFRASKLGKMELVDAPPDCDPETIKISTTKRITQTPIQCLNLDAYFIFNKKTKKWLLDTDFDRNIERRTWLLTRFLF